MVRVHEGGVVGWRCQPRARDRTGAGRWIPTRVREFKCMTGVSKSGAEFTGSEGEVRDRSASAGAR